MAERFDQFVKKDRALDTAGEGDRGAARLSARHYSKADANG
jgi:hypothetical protein